MSNVVRKLSLKANNSQTLASMSIRNFKRGIFSSRVQHHFNRRKELLREVSREIEEPLIRSTTLCSL